MAEIGIPKETLPGEGRVAATPDTVKKFAALGHGVVMEAGAGQGAGLDDEQYAAAGATITDRDGAWGAQLVLSVRGPSVEAVPLLAEGGVLIGLLDPFLQPNQVRALAAAGATSLAMEFVPRISRAQSMDALSSQSNIAGYRAVLLAAAALQRVFPMMTTAAGTLSPARVVVLGAGVAGLQAIATARRLGARVEVSDIRPETKLEVESLGARFIEVETAGETTGEGGYARQVSDEFLARQRQVLTERIAAADVVIATALVPGKRAPVLVTEEMVGGMRTGSVVVDMAASNGGNCALTVPGQSVVRHGVTILGPTNLPSEVAAHSTQMYARNLLNLVAHMTGEEGFVVDGDDEIVGPMLVTRGGEVVEQRVAAALEA
ncbi:Re/Si-specific NAD(P)(+) transhydrogenase subunit alpha [bacterium]|nr:Re/Si-specific NAD(P)(+) transhydrogenase subunit alpha [bacterium]